MRVIRSNDNGIQEQGWGGQYFMRRPACSGQVYRSPSKGPWGSRFGQLGLGLFGGICDSANSGNSPLLGRGSGAAGEEEGVFRGVSNEQRLIGGWWELWY